MQTFLFTNHFSLFDSDHNKEYNMLHGMWWTDLELIKLEGLIATINTSNKLKLKYSTIPSLGFPLNVIWHRLSTIFNKYLSSALNSVCKRMNYMPYNTHVFKLFIVYIIRFCTLPVAVLCLFYSLQLHKCNWALVCSLKLVTSHKVATFSLTCQMNRERKYMFPQNKTLKL